MVFNIIIQVLIVHPFKQTVDQTPRSVASDLGLHCLPTSHKKDDMLRWVKFCLVSDRGKGFLTMGLKLFQLHIVMPMTLTGIYNLSESLPPFTKLAPRF